MGRHVDEGAAARAVSLLTPPTDALRRMADEFRRAVERGAAGQPSPLLTLPTFVEQPRGDERGHALAVDWGGTNVRVALMDVAGGRVRPLIEEAFAFGDATKTGPAARLFDAIAAAVDRVLERAGRAEGDRGAAPSSPSPRGMPLGFAYSFPARQDRLDRAVAVSLTKGWRLAGLIGQDVGALLQDALARVRRGDVRVAAIVNDTVAALALQSYCERADDAGARPAEIGLIVGTGTNQAADLPGIGIRNLESGNFDRVDEVATPWDRAIERELPDPPPGAQRFEKMAAGGYLGEIVRRALADVGEPGQRLPAALDTPFALGTERVSRIAAGEAWDDVESLTGPGPGWCPGELSVLRQLARAVMSRAARLVATGLVGTLTAIDPELSHPHTIAVDGSVYGGYPDFSTLVRDGLVELVGAERARRVRLAYVRDATAAGAAVIAARR